MSDIARAIKEREQAFEAQYKLDEEQNFKIRARRDRLFGTWVAEKIGLQGEEAESYAVKAAQLDLEAPGDGNLLAKVVADLDEAGKVITNDELLTALTSALSDAQKSFREEYPEPLDGDHRL
ncbi:conserved hypothetical protein [Candidatus Terasakiella magnetica]|uniref:Aldolase n=1 Tax=Candidatus Terasakiella magnetica TaxID=1867952 RepID=A0A1C3RJ59_9PROT|nr:DUF1476 domain-containing protein [Candidatus Terasakiella magnetica]SCA57315.1 conserved hypothetical protein [Candidatus Terasakiella magnetica]